MPLNQIRGLEINYQRKPLLNLLKRRSVYVNSFRSLERVRKYLQNNIPVKVVFNRNDLSFMTRAIPFIEGMSSYFGAYTKAYSNV